MAHRMHINVTHLYADDDGETHLEDVEMLVPDPKDNAAIVTDNTLLVKSTTTGSLGDTTRPDYLLDQLQTMSFASVEK